MEPNRDRLRLLVDALINGGHEQGQGTLHRTEWRDGKPYSEQLCCLEVGNLVAFANGCPRPPYEEVGNVVHPGSWGVVTIRSYRDALGDTSARMLVDVADWYGLSADLAGNMFLRVAPGPEHDWRRAAVAATGSDGGAYPAIWANDAAGFSFTDIAADIVYTFGL